MSLEFLGGWLGGVSGLLVGYPLDTLKVARQLYPERSSLQSLRLILSRSGVTGLYSGVLSPISSYGFLVSLNFGVYGALCRSLQREDEALPLSSHALAGAASGTLLTLVSCPFEVVKVTMQAGAGTSAASTFSSTPACAAHVWRTQGIRGFYRGASLPANALTFVPGSALYFSAFAGISALLRDSEAFLQVHLRAPAAPGEVQPLGAEEGVPHLEPAVHGRGVHLGLVPPAAPPVQAPPCSRNLNCCIPLRHDLLAAPSKLHTHSVTCTADTWGLHAHRGQRSEVAYIRAMIQSYLPIPVNNYTAEIGR